MVFLVLFLVPLDLGEILIFIWLIRSQHCTPLCIRPHEDSICDFNNIIFVCLSILSCRLHLLSFLSFFDYITPDSNLLLNSPSVPIIHSNVNLFYSSGFPICIYILKKSMNERNKYISYKYIKT